MTGFAGGILKARQKRTRLVYAEQIGQSMFPPDDLAPNGRVAFEVAAKQVEGFPDPDDFAAAVLRFARAVDMADKVRAEWKSYGEPMLFTHTNGALVAHPLVKMLQAAEADAAKAGRALKLEPDAIKRAGPGRPPGASSAPDRKAAPPMIQLAAPKS